MDRKDWMKTAFVGGSFLVTLWVVDFLYHANTGRWPDDNSIFGVGALAAFVAYCAYHIWDSVVEVRAPSKKGQS